MNSQLEGNLIILIMLNWLPKVFVLVTLTHGNIITAENDVKGEYVGYIEKGHPDNHRNFYSSK